MTGFVEYLFYLLQRGLGLAAVAAVLCGIVLMAAHRVHRRKYGAERPFPWGKTVGLVMLAGYLAVVLAATVLRSAGGGGMNLHLGLAWREAWNRFTLKLWLNIILNIALFVPLGILLPLLWKRFRKGHWMLLAGFSLTLAIELGQMVTGNMTDVDDLLHNTLGAMLGWCAVMLILELRAKKFRRAAACLILPCAVAAVFGGVFLAYEMQEFGNLEYAPAFRAGTAGVQWTVDCDLTGSDTAPVYFVEPHTRETADAFGFALFERIGKECPHIYYYDNQTVMGNHSGGPFLNLNWLDRTWDLHGLEDPDRPAQVDEAGLRAELEQMGIPAPEGLLFSEPEEGVACLEAQMLRVGDTLYDGFIRRRIDTWGGYSLDYNMVTAQLVREVSILTPEQAAARLMDGHFYNGYWLDYYDIETVTVTDCDLTYMTDSKGYYQPVYVFRLESPREQYPYDAYVPAIR